ncbi:MAG TPA: 5-oxoprolinase subunit PxpA [Candidatus Limnocylindrales bacterium]|nr:5-oxoprolinase subunit PxpA [Candidatus Limnocylindrales bacterium]
MTEGRATIDLNADVGESLGPWPMGSDADLIPLVSSVNIACGFHAGDPATMARTVALAVRSGATIGAHPGYPDLAGFGRRDMDLTAEDLEAAIVYQVGALMGFARSAGAEVRHVKAHGALYNRAAADAEVAETVARAIRRCAGELILVGLASSALLDAGREAGLEVAAEAFPDRAYEADGSLRSRRLPGAVLTDSRAVADRAVVMARDGVVKAVDGTIVPLRADTLCLHGDTPGAVEHAKAVRAALSAAGIHVAPVGS